MKRIHPKPILNHAASYHLLNIAGCIEEVILQFDGCTTCFPAKKDFISSVIGVGISYFC